MDLRDEVKSRMTQTHKLAKKYYDNGDISRARLEYVKCAQLAKQLASLYPANRNKEFTAMSNKFQEIAEGLKEGNIKIYTDGVKPAEPMPQAVGRSGVADGAVGRGGEGNEVDATGNAPRSLFPHLCWDAHIIPGSSVRRGSPGAGGCSGSKALNS